MISFVLLQPLVPKSTLSPQRDTWRGGGHPVRTYNTKSLKRGVGPRDIRQLIPGQRGQRRRLAIADLDGRRGRSLALLLRERLDDQAVDSGANQQFSRQRSGHILCRVCMRLSVWFKAILEESECSLDSVGRGLVFHLADHGMFLQ